MNSEYINSKHKLQKTIAAVVQKYRKKHNKSITRISAEIMMTKSMWTDLEHGIKDPQFSTVWRVCEALGIGVEELVAEIKKELGDDFTLID